MNSIHFSKKTLEIDCENEVDKICAGIRHCLSRTIKRRGLVLGLSGGVDSSVTLALAVRAIGPERVLGLLMPERHSSEDTIELSKLVAEHYGVDKIHEDITPILDAIDFYRRYNDAVQLVIPDYDDRWQSKITISNIFEKRGFSLNYLVARSPEGEMLKVRLPFEAYLGIVAATSFKQRIRKMLEYYHADRLNYAVAGTPNRQEFDQGFFVKLGDGAADIKPIAHLYKSQVYQLADFLNVPERICSRPPTTDTYSLSQGQDEFYFSLPYDKFDLCLFAKNNGIKIDLVVRATGLTGEQVKQVYDDIDTKRNTTRYLHAGPILLGGVPEIN